MATTVKVKLVRSSIGTPQPQRESLRGLGLRKMNDERELEDSPSVRGMIARVSHLVSVAADAGKAAAGGKRGAKAPAAKP
jgi:large subunit ribosomal protein L30